MATYAIGDIQGCLESLERLVDRIGFDPARDRLWLVGDLVNRGPDSAGVLRWAMAQGDRVVSVLGNHDVKLLAVALGVRDPGTSDTFHDVLAAPDRDAMIDWLRRRPLVHHEDGHVLVHAGLAPEWTLDHVLTLAPRIEKALQGPDAPALLDAYGDGGDDASPRIRRLASALAVLTRIRTVGWDGEPDFDYSGPPEEAPAANVPWFASRTARSEVTFVVGHWAALGLMNERRLVALDTGCVWGGMLTAVRLDDRMVFQV